MGRKEIYPDAIQLIDLDNNNMRSSVIIIHNPINCSLCKVDNIPDSASHMYLQYALYIFGLH